MVDLMILKDVEVTGGRKRHFEHSLIHLTRHRVYQTFLLMAKVSDEKSFTHKLYNIIMSGMIQ